MILVWIVYNLSSNTDIGVTIKTQQQGKEISMPACYTTAWQVSYHTRVMLYDIRTAMPSKFAKYLTNLLSVKILRFVLVFLGVNPPNHSWSEKMKLEGGKRGIIFCYTHTAYCAFRMDGIILSSWQLSSLSLFMSPFLSFFLSFIKL